MPKGWYPDPVTPGLQRYWDGIAWTDTTHVPAAAGFPPPAAPARKTPAWAWVLLGVFAVMVAGVGGCFALVGSVASKMDGGSTPAASQQAAGAMGEEVRDGKFAFVVDSVEPADHWYGDPKPRGQWIIATVRVSNIGNEPQSFFMQNQKLIDGSGREYAADSMAAMKLNQDTMVLDLGPGFSLQVKIPFDVPVGSTAAALVLHDSLLSDGVKVNVR
ncbi:hypothetical protein AWB94_31485 [Mycolicibacterium canariasense]|nr:hypothetical protein AWB94_31485 [Mycolicibacterium canariasense]